MRVYTVIVYKPSDKFWVKQNEHDVSLYSYRKNMVVIWTKEECLKSLAVLWNLHCKHYLLVSQAIVLWSTFVSNLRKLYVFALWREEEFKYPRENEVSFL